LIDPDLHGDLFGRQQHFRPHPALHHLLKGSQQREQIDTWLVVVPAIADALVGPHPPTGLLAFVQRACRRLDLMLDSRRTSASRGSSADSPSAPAAISGRKATSST
jgi:hypothetical protein